MESNRQRLVQQTDRHTVVNEHKHLSAIVYIVLLLAARPAFGKP